MPVEDTSPHPMTVRTEGHKASCYNRGEFNESFPATNGYSASHEPCVGTVATFILTSVEHRMSRKCRQGVYETLPECEGCQAPKDLEYIERMRGVK